MKFLTQLLLGLCLGSGTWLVKLVIKGLFSFLVITQLVPSKPHWLLCHLPFGKSYFPSALRTQGRLGALIGNLWVSGTLREDRGSLFDADRLMSRSQQMSALGWVVVLGGHVDAYQPCCSRSCWRRNIKRENVRKMWGSTESGSDWAVLWTQIPQPVGFLEVLLPERNST